MLPGEVLSEPQVLSQFDQEVLLASTSVASCAVTVRRHSCPRSSACMTETSRVVQVPPFRQGPSSVARPTRGRRRGCCQVARSWRQRGRCSGQLEERDRFRESSSVSVNLQLAFGGASMKVAKNSGDTPGHSVRIVGIGRCACRPRWTVSVIWANSALDSARAGTGVVSTRLYMFFASVAHLRAVAFDLTVPLTPSNL